MHTCPNPPCKDTCATCKTPPDKPNAARQVAFVTQTRTASGGYQTVLAKPQEEGSAAGWQHVAGVWDPLGDVLRVYINGTVVGTRHPKKHGFEKALDCTQNSPECMEGRPRFDTRLANPTHLTLPYLGCNPGLPIGGLVHQICPYCIW